jgi:diadenosine tetraphosphate (Ap4A) HIT family hydrolase
MLSLGSRQGNAHVDWHLVPLRPGVPYDQQQLAAFDWGRGGVRDLDGAVLEELAAAIRSELR